MSRQGRIIVHLPASGLVAVANRGGHRVPPSLCDCWWALLDLRALRAFFAFLALGQLVTVILVFCLTTAPDWAVIVVGMTRLVPQKLPFGPVLVFAPSAEWGPCGSSVSKLVTGASGTVSKWL
jgi:hypothetical protein